MIWIDESPKGVFTVLEGDHEADIGTVAVCYCRGVADLIVSSLEVHADKLFREQKDSERVNARKLLEKLSYEELVTLLTFAGVVPLPDKNGAVAQLMIVLDDVKGAK